MGKLRKASGRAVWVGAVAAITVSVQLATANPVSAIEGWEIRAGGEISDPRAPFKKAKVGCSRLNKRVVGGGALIEEEGTRKRVRLVGMFPTNDPFAGNVFEVRAECPHLFCISDWSLTAFAICVDGAALTGYQVVRNFVNVPSSGGPFQHTAARCPSGTIAYGAGGRVFSPEAQSR